MKKFLLGIFALSTAVAAMADTETKIIQDFIVGLSVDGRYAASNFYGSVVIYDLDTDEHFDYMETSNNDYVTGLGNFWSERSMVGVIDNTGTSAVWRNGRWTKLPLAGKDPAGMGMANGITPDMSRICGNASTGVGLVLDDAKLMVYPCYWNANANGTYGQQTPLPYPSKDFMGYVPQYVTAISITDDGKSIWGQIRSSDGFFHEPVVYKEAEDGTWSYETPLRDKIIPEGLKIVDYPGEGPACPSQESFMTDEELAAFDEAYVKYLSNPSLYKSPEYEDYMTPEEIAAYTEAKKPYDEWQVKWDAYDEMRNEIIEKGLTFCFNVMRISPNGRYVAMVTEHLYYNGEGQTISVYRPYLLDTETGKGELIGKEGYSMVVTSVNNNGDVLAYQDAGGADLGFVYQNETGEWITYADYLIGRDPSLRDWIVENWVHEVEVETDPTLGTSDFVELDISGMPFVSADWNTFSSVAYNFWGGNTKGEYLSYIIRFDENSAIDEIQGGDSNSAPMYFDLQGRRVLAPSNGIFIKRQGKETIKIAL